MPAYFYLYVRSCICANILEILAASHCLSKENNRCVSAKRLAGWCHCDPVLGLILLKGCSSWEGLPAWAQGVNLNGPAVCTLREGLCGSCPVSLKVDLLLENRPKACCLCLVSSASKQRFLIFHPVFLVGYCHWIGSITHLNNTLVKVSLLGFVSEIHVHIPPALKNTVIVSFLWFCSNNTFSYIGHTQYVNI